MLSKIVLLFYFKSLLEKMLCIDKEIEVEITHGTVIRLT